ncbi:MAG: hypothetical protein HWE26_14460 [Alteromonadaceae bacterium]|nr:hypothetical protein [Alteromonadaceae bacterium]
MNKDSKKLPADIRILIAIVSIPALLSIYTTGLSIYFGEWQFSYFGLLYPALGLLAIYIVVVGKIPIFMSRKDVSN